MTKASWKKVILEQMELQETYEENFPEVFATVIDSLSEILEQKDKIYKEFKKSGGLASPDGSRKNPVLVMWNELNKTALAYWRELGMTPSAYKRITGEVKKAAKPKGLAEILAKIES